jgi:hypothetical protein
MTTISPYPGGVNTSLPGGLIGAPSIRPLPSMLAANPMASMYGQGAPSLGQGIGFTPAVPKPQLFTPSSATLQRLGSMLSPVQTPTSMDYKSIFRTGQPSLLTASMAAQPAAATSANLLQPASMMQPTSMLSAPLTSLQPVVTFRQTSSIPVSGEEDEDEAEEEDAEAEEEEEEEEEDAEAEEEEEEEEEEDAEAE